MSAISVRFLCCLTFTLAVAAGCSNPTADKPKAEVSDPVPEASETAASPGEQSPEAAKSARLDAEPAGTVYVLTDDGSGIDFEGYKVTGAHVGGFGEFQGTVTVPDGNIEAGKIDLTIDMTSIYSDNPDLTGTLKGEDFFEVETYPTATFKSTKIEQMPDGTYAVTGDLTMHGVTKRVTFPASIALDEDTLTAEAEFTINRFDWEINYKGVADDLIRKDVLIFFLVEAHAADAGETEEAA